MTIRFNKKAKSAEILLYGSIGASWWGDSITAVDFKKELKNLGEIDEISLRINSEGGSVFDAAAIYNSLVEHPARVVAHVDGMALSAASVILMAGEERHMAENAFIMIHDPWSMVAGDSRALRKEADLLDQIKSTIVKMYVDRTGISVEEAEQLMSDETWMTADEAKEKGFIDSITENLKVAASFDATRFNRVPDWARNRSKTDEPEQNLARRQRLARMNQRVARFAKQK